MSLWTNIFLLIGTWRQELGENKSGGEWPDLVTPLREEPAVSEEDERKLSLHSKFFLGVVFALWRHHATDHKHTNTHTRSDRRCPTLCSITRLHRGAAVIPSWLRTAWVAMGRRNSSVTLSGSPYVSWNQAPPIMTWKTRPRTRGFFKTDKYLNFYAVKVNTFLVCRDQTVDSRQQDGFTLNVSSLILKAFSFLINLEIGMCLCVCEIQRAVTRSINKL